MKKEIEQLKTNPVNLILLKLWLYPMSFEHWEEDLTYELERSTCKAKYILSFGGVGTIIKGTP